MQRKSIDFLLRCLDVLRLNFCKKIIDYKIKVWYYNTARGTGTPERNKRVATNASRKAKKGNSMTNREFYNAVANGTMSDEIKDFAKDAIVKMDERNAKRNSKPSKTSVENETIKKNIMEFISNQNDFCIAGAIAEALEISTQKASALCRQLVEAGKLLEKEIKIPKQGKRKAYGIA